LIQISEDWLVSVSEVYSVRRSGEYTFVELKGEYETMFTDPDKALWNRFLSVCVKSAEPLDP
jgi:hypothetical protein